MQKKDDPKPTLPPTAIDVPATQASTTSQPAMLEGLTDLARSMAEQLTSWIVCAAPHTGKDCLIVTALDYLAELRSDVELWAIDLKNEPGEDAYYARFDSAKLLRVSLMKFDKPEGADDAIVQLFRDFNASTATTKLLWLNECVTAAAKLRPKLWKNIQDFAVGLCSAGSTGSDGQTRHFLWIDTQSPNVSDIGLRTNASHNVFRRVFLMNGDCSLLASALSSGFAAEPQPETNSQLEATGAKVLAYDSRSDSWRCLTTKLRYRHQLRQNPRQNQQMMSWT